MIHKIKPPFQLHKFHTYMYVHMLCQFMPQPEPKPGEFEHKEFPLYTSYSQPEKARNNLPSRLPFLFILKWNSWCWTELFWLMVFLEHPDMTGFMAPACLRESRSNPEFGSFFPASPRRQESNLLSTCVLIKRQEQQSQPPMNYLSKRINISPNKHHVSIPRFTDTVEWMEAQKW